MGYVPRVEQTPDPIDRRSLLKRGALLGGAAAFGGALPALGRTGNLRRGPAQRAPRPDSILNHPAVEAPIDTIVVLMMENRSVDHHLGWLAGDQTYLAEG
jgi:phospholipase C